MPELHGNLEGIKKATLTEIKALYDEQIPAETFIPYPLLEKLCGFSLSVNREIALYISRYGDILDVIIGKSDRIDLPELSLRRSAARLSMVRCVHTHPNDGGELSDVDLSALVTVQLDAMCSVGVGRNGSPTTAQCAFLNPDVHGETTLSEVVSAKSLPDAAWLRQIEDVDANYRAALPASQADIEKAVLVGIEGEDSLAELAQLSETAGAITLESILQKRDRPDPLYCVGKGKAEELALTVQTLQANLVIFDEELSGVMQRNLEELLQVKVIDRTALILDIFALRARTSEGKLQVEMAQLKYRSQRLLGQGLVLSRLAGGIGTRGPGESKLEVSRRRIRERMADLERQLRALESQRSLRRKRREKNRIPIVALVGYTNAGKSTLFNRLTGADVYVKDALFATLDNVSRPVTLPRGGRALLIDTVGFIHKLPHDLIEAFHATLEEAALADVIVVVSDGSSSYLLKHHKTVQEVLQNLGASEAPQIHALNKADLMTNGETADPDAIRISALHGDGLDALLMRIEKAVSAHMQAFRVFVPFSAYHMLNRIRKGGVIREESYRDDGVVLTVEADRTLMNSIRKEGIRILDDEII
ncbi:MAG: GTPase HflX [Clostridiales bacterium]|nr:GTPase HflX [Clostridiales bacterium]